MWSRHDVSILNLKASVQGLGTLGYVDTTSLFDWSVRGGLWNPSQHTSIPEIESIRAVASSLEVVQPYCVVITNTPTFAHPLL